MIGGTLRDVISQLCDVGRPGRRPCNPALGYSVVYHIEIYLLFFTLIALGPLVRVRTDPTPDRDGPSALRISRPNTWRTPTWSAKHFSVTFDLASAAIWGFWLFFALLVYYLQTESMREGYPLEDETEHGAAREGLFSLARDKTFKLPHGRGEVVCAFGPARGPRPIWRLSGRRCLPGRPIFRPVIRWLTVLALHPGHRAATCPSWTRMATSRSSRCRSWQISASAAGRDPRGKAVVAGDGEVVGRVIDMWVDVPEQLVRYLTVDLNPEGSGKTRLIPMTMARIKSDRVTVRSIYATQFDRRAAGEDRQRNHAA